MKQQIELLLNLAGINVTKVLVLGSFVHVDSFQKYNDTLQHVFTAAGFVIVKASDCLHLDGYNGYRMSAKLAPQK